MPARKRRPNVKVAKPPILFKQTQLLVNRIEKSLGKTFITYWNSHNGSVCQDDVVGFYEILRAIGPKEEMVLFIKSDGGEGMASLRMVHLLRQYAKKLTVLAPLNCVSAATMLALGADEIHMGPLAYLSAVDTSLTHELSPIDKDNQRVSVSQNELQRILTQWQKMTTEEDSNPYKTVFKHVHPLVIGAVDRASLLSIWLCREILSYHMSDKEKAERISHTLNSDYPAHTYPITIREAERIGLNVKPLNTDVNDLLLSLNELYSEMGQRAHTDFDEGNYHDNEILNIIEGSKVQVHYQIDKDWHYRTEERRWISLNDKSSWHKNEMVKGKMVQSTFHIR